MTISINMRGHTRAESSIKLQKHIERDELSEEEQKRIRENTDSQIFGDRTHTNVELFRATHEDNRELYEGLFSEDGINWDEPVGDVMKLARDIDDVVQADRKASGHRKQDKRANISMSGTLQLGDDSLKLIGYDKKKPRWEQEEKAQLVEMIYSDVVRSVQSQKDVYGYMQLAKLHLDEGSPHVDMAFLAKPVRDEKGVLKSGVREILNGKEGTPRGQKMKTMQDLLTAEVERLAPELLRKYNVVRGESNSKKMDRVRESRKNDELIAEQQVELFANYEEIERLKREKEELEKQLREKDDEVQEKEVELREKEVELRGKKIELQDLKHETNSYINVYRTKINDYSKTLKELDDNFQKSGKSFKDKVVLYFDNTLEQLRKLGRKVSFVELRNALVSGVDELSPYTEPRKQVQNLSKDAENLANATNEDLIKMAQDQITNQVRQQINRQQSNQFTSKGSNGPNLTS